MDKKGNEKNLYFFKGGNDGYTPFAGLVRDSAGDLYGTTEFGGDVACNFGAGCGTVFKLDVNGVHTVLYRFHGGQDGEDLAELLTLTSMAEDIDSIATRYKFFFYRGDYEPRVSAHRINGGL